jgi:dTDP-4-amino-4,6-dideoxygalactose transaminase
MTIFMKDLEIPYESLALLNEPFREDIETALSRVVKKGWYILGSEVTDFEKEFAAYVGAPHCAGVASGLDALIIALQVLKLPAGAEVIVPANTYIATVLAILREGFTPVLVEPDSETCNIDPRRIESAITPKTKAIMVVHLYGKACEMDLISEIATRHKLPIIEDCAQSHGAKFQGRMTGTWGLGAFSFYPTKNLGAMGDAGALVTQSQGDDETTRMIRNYGSKIKYYNEVVGMNSRLDEMQAALLRVKLRRLDEVNEHKRSLATVYFTELSGITDLILPKVTPECHDVYHIFNVRTGARDQLREHLRSSGIGTEIHYPVAPHLQNAMKEQFSGMKFPISERIHQTTLSLPISFCHSKEQIKSVCKVIKGFYGK